MHISDPEPRPFFPSTASVRELSSRGKRSSPATARRSPDPRVDARPRAMAAR